VPTVVGDLVKPNCCGGKFAVAIDNCLQETELGVWACSMRSKRIQSFYRKHEMEEALARTNCSWEDNIKMNHKEIGCEDVD
jgi:hypothetical protein